MEYFGVNTLCDKKGFSCKHDSLDFSHHNFSDVKYLYFLCFGMYSFCVRLGSVLGL